MFYFKERKQRQLATLHEYNSRLKSVVSELLARADEIDQQSKYTGVPDAGWSQLLREACTDLVKLGDQLPVIDRFLSQEEVGAARKVILECCRKADGVSRQLEKIRRTNSAS